MILLLLAFMFGLGIGGFIVCVFVVYMAERNRKIYGEYLTRTDWEDGE